MDTSRTLVLHRLKRPSKENLSAEVASLLGLKPPPVSAGATVLGQFIDDVSLARFGSLTGGTDAYRRTERLLTSFGLLYDPRWDTSESRGVTGGSTVTTRAFSRLLVALSHAPRCFLVEHPRGQDIDVLEFKRIADRDPFAEAGPGAKILLFDSRRRGGAVVHSVAEVARTDPGWRASPWRAGVSEVTPLASSVNFRLTSQLPRRPTEVAWTDYVAVLDAAGEHDFSKAHDGAEDRGAPHVAERVDRDFPADRVPIGIAVVPERESDHDIDIRDPEVAQYQEDVNGSVTQRVESDEKSISSRSDRKLDLIAERRAITLARRALEADGWVLVRDCQADGVGFDLLFCRDDRMLKVEVKGIRGARREFNVTPKELWRATTDADWVLAAVTRVLSPSEPTVHIFSRGQVTKATKTVTGYRVWPD